MNEISVMTKEYADRLVRQFIEERLSSVDRWSQLRRMFDKLSELCVSEALARGDDDKALWRRLLTTLDLLEQIPFRWARSAIRNDRPDNTQNLVWRRHDPERSLQEGYQSKHHFDGDCTDTLRSYLENPSLRSPDLDAIFLDMLVTKELCAFGEEMKKTGVVPIQRFCAGKDYWATHGDLIKMKKFDWDNTVALWVGGGFVWIFALALEWGLPIGLIIWTFKKGDVGWALGLLAAYAIYRVFFFNRWLIKYVPWVLRGRPGSKKEVALKWLKLWGDMYRVWRMLESPVVNPTVVREEMRKTTDQGAAWPQGAWALIDRVIADNPAVWLTS